MNKIKYMLLLVFIILISGCSTHTHYHSKPIKKIVKKSPVPHNVFVKAGRKFGINYKTLRAIAEVESNNNSLTVNVNKGSRYQGGHRFNSITEANTFMDYTLDREDANYDVGVCQINTWWFDKLNLTNEMLLNPKKNIETAAYIYKYNLSLCNNEINCALSMYNTGKKNSEIGKKYTKKVLLARAKLYTK